MEKKALSYPADFPLFSGMEEHGSLAGYVEFLAAAIEEETESMLEKVDECGETEADAAVMLRVLEGLEKVRGIFEEWRK